MKSSLTFASFLLVLSALTACKGGGGGGGSGVSITNGSFNVFNDTSLGNTCLGYVMDQDKCQAITGTWSAASVSAQYGCVDNNSAGTGTQASAVCVIDGKRLTATRVINQAAVDTCQNFGGIVTPTSQVNCEASGVDGTWQIITAASTTHSCNQAPTTSGRCASVGGTWGPMYRLGGRPFPSYNSDLSGVANLRTGLDVPTGYNFSVGTQILEITGKATLSSLGVGGTDHWQTPVTVSRYSDFFAAADGSVDFQMYFGDEFNSEAMYNGLLVDLNIFYKKDF